MDRREEGRKILAKKVCEDEHACSHPPAGEEDSCNLLMGLMIEGGPYFTISATNFALTYRSAEAMPVRFISMSLPSGVQLNFGLNAPQNLFNFPPHAHFSRESITRPSIQFDPPFHARRSWIDRTRKVMIALKIQIGAFSISQCFGHVLV